MKKAIAMILVLVLALGLCACGGKNGKQDDDGMVTVYVPATITVQGADGQKDVAELVYEDGWQSKDTFTISYKTKAQGDITMTVGEKSQTITYGENIGIERVEIRFDDQGRQLSQTVVFPESSYTTKSVITSVYDEKGRMVEQTLSQEMGGGDTPLEITQEFTVEETETGATATGRQAGTVTTLTYNKAGKLLSSVMTSAGQEVNRTDNEYDANGCLVKTSTYSNGELVSATVTVFKTVKLTPEAAARLPQYVRK